MRDLRREQWRFLNLYSNYRCRHGETLTRWAEGQVSLRGSHRRRGSGMPNMGSESRIGTEAVGLGAEQDRGPFHSFACFSPSNGRVHRALGPSLLCRIVLCPECSRGLSDHRRLHNGGRPLNLFVRTIVVCGTDRRISRIRLEGANTIGVNGLAVSLWDDISPDRGSGSGIVCQSDLIQSRNGPSIVSRKPTSCMHESD
jgi:hypothetical protein